MTKRFIKPLMLGLTVGLSCSSFAGTWNASDGGQDAAAAPSSVEFSSTVGGYVYAGASTDTDGHFDDMNFNTNNVHWDIDLNLGADWSADVTVALDDAATHNAKMRTGRVVYSPNEAVSVSWGRQQAVLGAVFSGQIDDQFGVLNSKHEIIALTSFDDDFLNVGYKMHNLGANLMFYKNSDDTAKGSFEHWAAKVDAVTSTSGINLLASISYIKDIPTIAADTIDAAVSLTAHKPGIGGVTAECTGADKNCSLTVVSVGAEREFKDLTAKLNVQFARSSELAVVAPGTATLTENEKNQKLSQMRIGFEADLSNVLKQKDITFAAAYEKASTAVLDVCKNQYSAELRMGITKSVTISGVYDSCQKYGTTKSAQQLAVGAEFSIDH